MNEENIVAAPTPLTDVELAELVALMAQEDALFTQSSSILWAPVYEGAKSKVYNALPSLLARLAVAEALKWVSVTEYLPEPGVKVLILYGPYDHLYEGHMEVGYRVQAENTENWWWAGLETLPTQELISHWLTIPVTPQSSSV